MSQCCVWDFTLAKDKHEIDDIVKFCDKHCKKYAFQLEKGDSGFEHYQGRINLKIKKRLSWLKESFSESGHFSITSNENRNNMFYVLKDDSRISGPWTDENKPLYVPKQVREINKLYKWQESIIEISKIWDTRSINVIIDIKGCTGKSTIVNYMVAHGLANRLPPCNDIKDIMRAAMNMKKSNCYLIDLPRAMKKEKIAEFFAGIESLKDGYIYDDRYTFKFELIDCPNIFVFTNCRPDENYLSEDRWKFWYIGKNKKLIQTE